VLEGGIKRGGMTEIFGGASCGKTQFCFSCSVQAAAMNLNVMFIDVMGTFSSLRLREMWLNQGREITALMGAFERIHCYPVHDAWTLFKFLNALKEKMEEGRETYFAELGLIVVDGFSFLLSRNLGTNLGYGWVREIGKMMDFISRNYKIAFLVTNYEVGGRDGEKKAGLGRNWATVSKTSVKFDLISGILTVKNEGTKVTR